MKSLVRGSLLVAGLLAGTAGASEAADPPPPLGWYSTSGLSFVMAAGNSRASTLGAKVEMKRRWPRATFTLGGSAVGADATDPPVGRRADSPWPLPRRPSIRPSPARWW